MSSPKIITLTLNPAIDRSGKVPQLLPGEKLRCVHESCHPGGGGINVARMLSRFGADVTAIFPTGGLTGELLKCMIRAERLNFISVDISGTTREDVSILNLSNGAQFRFIFPGTEMIQSDLQRCCDLALSHITAGCYFVMSGSLPPGASVDTYASLTDKAAEKGARVVLDSHGDMLVRSLGPALELFKLNELELEEITGTPVYDRERCIAAARLLLASGARMAAITRGAKGALLVTISDAWDAKAPAVHPVSTIGAGDTFLAALVLALACHRAPDEGLREAVAAGSAALLTEGTGLARPEDVESLVHQVIVESIHVMDPLPIAVSAG
jgi:6-phosphofructokinase 2